MARFLGAEQVIACDLNTERSALATRFGASHFATPDQLLEQARDLTEGRGADVTLEFSGDAAAVLPVLIFHCSYAVLALGVGIRACYGIYSAVGAHAAPNHALHATGVGAPFLFGKVWGVHRFLVAGA
jgi:threonine dehydrogenase-like Zn-dependent dehydrogenase